MAHLSIRSTSYGVIFFCGVNVDSTEEASS